MLSLAVYIIYFVRQNYDKLLIPIILHTYFSISFISACWDQWNLHLGIFKVNWVLKQGQQSKNTNFNSTFKKKKRKEKKVNYILQHLSFGLYILLSWILHLWETSRVREKGREKENFLEREREREREKAQTYRRSYKSMRQSGIRRNSGGWWRKMERERQSRGMKRKS